MPKFQYNKIVRDRIPEDIREQGGIVVDIPLSKTQFAQELKEKLREEMSEFLEASTPQECLEEAGDILDVLIAYLDQHGYTQKDLEKARNKKREARGTFSKPRKILHVDVPDNALFKPFIAYCRQHAIK